MTSFDALVQVLRVLNNLNIPYMLVGSFSSNFYSYPRASKDADIVIQYSEGDLGRIRECLDSDFAMDMQMSFETLTGSIRNILTHLPSKFDIEFFRLNDDAHNQQRFARRKTVAVPELNIIAVLPTAEDVIIQKLRWRRDKDIDDARKVMQTQSERLDWEYIRNWTTIHESNELFEKLAAECRT